LRDGEGGNMNAGATTDLKTRDRTDGILYVELIGTLDVVGTNQVSAKFNNLVAPARKPTILDLSQVDFMSSIGIGMIVSCAGALRRRGVKMAALGANGTVAEVWRIVGLGAIVPVCASEADAVKAVTPAPAV